MPENQAVIHECIGTKANDTGDQWQMGLLGRPEGNGKRLRDRDDQEAQRTCSNVWNTDFDDFRKSCENAQNVMRKECTDTEKQDSHAKGHTEREPYGPAYIGEILGTKKLRHKSRCPAHKAKDKQPVYKKELH